VLHDAQGLTMAEVADIQDVALPAAKQWLRRGRMMLGTELAEGARAATDPEVPMRCWDVRQWVSDDIDAELTARERTYWSPTSGAARPARRCTRNWWACAPP